MYQLSSSLTVHSLHLCCKGLFRWVQCLLLMGKAWHLSTISVRVFPVYTVQHALAEVDKYSSKVSIVHMERGLTCFPYVAVRAWAR